MKIVIVFLIIYLVFLKISKGYYVYYPSLPIYPNNDQELKSVKQFMLGRTRDDIDFFHLTNKSVYFAFLPYVNEPPELLQKILRSQNNIIFFFKYTINRLRPWQLKDGVKPINIRTARTPAYPAGHAYQAYLLAKYLTKKYPKKKQLFMDIALKCDNCRIKAGLHYPSDGVFARKLVDYFNNF